MPNRKNNIQNSHFLMAVGIAAMCMLFSCKPASLSTPPASEDAIKTNEITSTTLIATREPAATQVRIPPTLPGLYHSEFLNPLDAPTSYIQDTCRYLRNKWHPMNAQPGTVVMIIMIQGVYKGPVEESGGINVVDLGNMMTQLHEQGFQAINTEKFLAFMERNIKIPPRSVLIIQDNRHQADNFNKHFRDYWEDWGWPIVNGWQSQPDTLESLWQENIVLENEGWVDHQAQGVMIGTYMTDDSSKAVITRELEGSIDAFAERFGKTPIAFIWPGGGFGQRPVLAARQLGYQLGFTSNSRGPVMYNWVPLAHQVDPARPTYIPEAQIGDPLMTLPRYWPYQVSGAIDKVRIMGNEAAAYAQANKAIELEYYDIVCSATHSPLPSP
jgi:hypothetical protein